MYMYYFNPATVSQMYSGKDNMYTVTVSEIFHGPDCWYKFGLTKLLRKFIDKMSRQGAHIKVTKNKYVVSLRRCL